MSVTAENVFATSHLKARAAFFSGIKSKEPFDRLPKLAEIQSNDKTRSQQADSKTTQEYLTLHYETIKGLNPATFKFYNTEEKKKLEERLVSSYYFLYSRFEAHRQSYEKECFAKDIQELHHCAQLIDALEASIVQPDLGVLGEGQKALAYYPWVRLTPLLFQAIGKRGHYELQLFPADREIDPILMGKNQIYIQLNPVKRDGSDSHDLCYSIKGSDGKLLIKGIIKQEDISKLKDKTGLSPKDLEEAKDEILEILARRKQLETQGADSNINLTSRKKLTYINGHRLYWVWTSTLLGSLLAQLPEDFFNRNQAMDALTVPPPYTGFISWSLYYLRGANVLGPILKDTFNPWAGYEDFSPSIKQRLAYATRASYQEKFALLNDFIWGTANLLCYYYFKGAGTLGLIGNVLTVLLLLMDLSLNIWRGLEAKAQHEKKIEELNQILVILRGNKNRLEMELGLLETWEPQSALIARLKAQIQDFDKRIAEIEAQIANENRSWKHQSNGLINDIVYSAVLLFAFCMVVSFFFPLAPATATMLEIAGAALAFSSTAIWSALGGSIEVAQIRDEANVLEAKLRETLTQFKQEKTEDGEKKLCIELFDLKAKLDYQHALAEHKQLNVIRSSLIDILVPVVFFSSFVFLPMGLGIVALVSAWSLACLSKVLMDEFEPKEPGFEDFDEERCKEIKAKQLSFFGLSALPQEEAKPLQGNFVPNQSHP